MHGRVLDEDGRAVPDALVEIWQCNAAGRYHHPGDQHDAPLDPNFYGGGRARADAEGRYQFTTIKPGAYPWGNHHNAWRPAHIHFSLFGPAFATRLITQMYFPDDPLLALDPIYNSVPDVAARKRLRPPSTSRPPSRISPWATASTSCCAAATPLLWKTNMPDGLTPSQTIGPFYWGTLVKAYEADLAPPGVAGERIALALTLHDVNGAVIPDGMVEIWQANSHGRYAHPEDRRNLPLDADFDGFGRASTDTAGVARFTTVRPGRVPWPEGGMQAPHINISIFARGVLNRLATRLYFEGDPALRRGSGAEIDRARPARDAACQAGRLWRVAAPHPYRRRARNRLLRLLTSWPVFW